MTRRELLDRLPRGLAAALAGRDALIAEIWREGPRVFLRANSKSGALLGRYSRDPLDEIRYKHELAVRRVIGAHGFLRTPAVLDDGSGWLLESAIETEPCRGAHAVDTVVTAASALADLRLPEVPRELRPPRRWRNELQVALNIGSSGMSYGDYRAARRVLATSPLPNVTSHGDFRPDKVLLRAGAAWVIDWESSGSKPAGYDLMQFWCELERVGDRERLFVSTLELVGMRRRRELERLRFAVAVVTATKTLIAPETGVHDRDRERRLLSLVLEARESADTI